jgi:CubicO group peptidase (beta-lactamase class C family)
VRDFLPFFLPAVGLFWVVVGAWTLLSTFRRGSQAAVGTSASSESPETTKANPLAWLGRRLGGLFWFCLGIATVRFSDDRIMTVVGVFWAVVGACSLLTSRKRRLLVARPEPASQSSQASKPRPLAFFRSRRFTGLFLLGAGIATLWFSDIRIGASPAAVSQSREADSPLAELVTRHVEREFQQRGHIGLVVGVVSKDQAVLLGFGSQRLGDSLRPTADTVFEIGSISKAFTGILLARLVESGEVELDDRIGELLPEGWTLSEAAREVTLRHLTTHTSGFPRLPANLLGFTNVFRHLFGGDPYRSYSEEQFREALAAVELEFEPGTAREYSNFAVGLLGYVLATQNRTDYETLLTSGICKPLGMHQTVITNDQWHDEHLAPGYRGTLKIGPAMLALGSSQWELPNHLAGAGAIRSTGRDMLRFLKANMGLIHTPIDAAIRRSHQELYKERPDMAMGMNWIRSIGDSTAQPILWHNGGTGGYTSYLGFTEDRQFGVVVLSNTSNSVDDLGEGILEALARSSGGHKPVTKHGYAKVAPFSGVRWENDRPIVRVQDRWSPLVSIDGAPIDRIMEFAQKEFGSKARKRLAEDLVELLATMGHEPGWEVTLGLETSDGQVEHLKVMMTEENRDLVRE